MAPRTLFETARIMGHLTLRAVAVASTVAGWLAALMLVSAVAITCEMIFVRFVLNGSTVWQSEAVIYLVIASTMVGLAYVERQRGHVNVDLLPVILSPRLRFVLEIVTMLASITIIAILLFYGWKFWYYAWVRGWRSDSVWGVKLWIPYLSVPVGFALLLAQMITEFLALIAHGHLPRPPAQGAN